MDDQMVGRADSLRQQVSLRIRAEQQLAALVAEFGDRESAVDTAQELAQMGSWTWEIGTDIVAWSAQVHRIFGTDPAGPAPTYEAYVEMLHPEDRERVLAAIRHVAVNGGSYQLDHRIIRTDGLIREIRGAGRRQADAAGVPVRLNGSLQDVTTVRAAERELHRSRDLFAAVLDAATEQSIIATDADGLITVFNTGAERMLGYRAEEMIGRSPERLHDAGEIAQRAHELGIEPGFGVFLAFAALGRSETRQWTYLTRDGRRLQALITVTAMRGCRGQVTGYIKVGTDVTDRLAAEAALRESEARFRQTFQDAPTGMMLMDLNSDPPTRLMQVNPALCRLTGYTAEQLLEMTVTDLTAEEHLESIRERLDALRQGRPVSREVERHWITADGRDLWVQFNVSPPAGAINTFAVGQVQNITARRQDEARLTHQALHDNLTGLPNRLLLMDRIEHALAAAERSHRKVSLLYLDLDGFKAVNDTAGHAAGDRALIEVGARLRMALRPGDTVARLGGDEFVVVCDGLDDAAEAKTIAERLLSVVRAPYVHRGATFHLSVSIGVSLSGVGTQPEQLLRLADQAMYEVKRAGKGRVGIGGFNDPHLIDQSERASRAVRFQAELAQALLNDALTFFGQPVRDLRTGKLVAVETSIRWQHPDRGLLEPDEFLDVVEVSDLMVPIGTRALTESCRLAASWWKIWGQAAPRVHVNIWGRQLESGDLAKNVEAALDRYELPAAQLVLELTETHVPALADSFREDLLRLRELGVKIAIDELGTGYSSLTGITELPVDMLKIDTRFVARIAPNPLPQPWSAESWASDRLSACR